MELIELYLIACVGTVVWVINAEVATMAYAGMEDPYSPLVLGLVATLGQCTSYLIFLYGGKTIGKLKSIQKLVRRTEERFAEKMKAGFLSLTVTAAILGVPPVIALVLLAKPFGMSAWPVIGIAFAGRIIRFTACAVFGEALFDTFSLSALFQ